MNTYQIQIKGQNATQANGNNPMEAFTSIVENYTLTPIENPFMADVCITLVGGKRQSRHFYKMVQSGKQTTQQYCVCVKNGNQKVVESTSPEKAFESLYNGMKLKDVTDFTEADVCIYWVYKGKKIMRYYKQRDMHTTQLAKKNLFNAPPKDIFVRWNYEDYQYSPYETAKAWFSCEFKGGIEFSTYCENPDDEFYSEDRDLAVRFLDELAYAIRKLLTVNEITIDFLVIDDSDIYNAYFDSGDLGSVRESYTYTYKFVKSTDSIFNGDKRLECSLRDFIYTVWLHKYELSLSENFDALTDIWADIAKEFKFEKEYNK